MLHNFLRGLGDKNFEYVGGSSATWTHTANGTPSGFISTSLTALTGGTGSTAMPGDLVIAAIGGSMNNVYTDQDMYMVTSDYTEICDEFASDAERTNLGVFYKIMGSTPDSVASGSTTSDGLVRIITAQVFRGVNQSVPIDVTTVTANGINSGVPNPPSITPTTPGSLIITVGCEGGYNAGGSYALLMTAPDGMTLLSSDLAYDTGGRPRCGLALATTYWTGGAYDPPVFNNAVVNNYCSWCAATLAIRPA